MSRSPISPYLARLLRERAPREAQEDMTWLERAWAGAQDRLFNRPEPDLSPIERTDQPGLPPYVAAGVRLDPFEASRSGLQHQVDPFNLDQYGANFLRWLDYQGLGPGTGFGHPPLQSADPDAERETRTIDFGSYKQDMSFLAQEDREPFQYDPDFTYFDLAAEHGFEGPKQFLAAMAWLLFEPGPMDLWRVAGLPFGRLTSRLKMNNFNKVLNDAIATVTTQRIAPHSLEALENFHRDLRRLTARADLSNTQGGEQRIVWRVPGTGSYANQSYVMASIESPDRSVRMVFEYDLRSPERGVYVHALTNTKPNSMAGAEVPQAFLELLDAWGVPAVTSPLGFGTSHPRAGLSGLESGVLLTDELRGMYNRMGFVPYDVVDPAVRTQMHLTPNKMYRAPVAAGFDDASQAARAAEFKAREHQPTLAAANQAQKDRVAAEKANLQRMQAQQALQQAQPPTAAAPHSRAAYEASTLIYNWVADPNSVRADLPVDPAAHDVIAQFGNRIPNPRRVIAEAVQQYGASPHVGNAFEELLVARGDSAVQYNTWLHSPPPSRGGLGPGSAADVRRSVLEPLQQQGVVPRSLAEELANILEQWVVQIPW